MRRRGFLRTIGLIAVIIVVIGFAIFYLVGPSAGWPKESRRVSHLAGFSVIRPEGWEQHMSFTRNGQPVDNIRFLPEKAVGSPGVFLVTKYPTPIDEDTRVKRGYTTEITFAGRKAWEKRIEGRAIREHQRNILFSDNGTWFELSVKRPLTESLDHGVWEAYLESFRIEPIRPEAATMPSLVPSTLPTP